MRSDHECTARPVAVITGASRGIGAAYARALAARGHDLLLVARDTPRLTQLCGELAAQYRVRAESLVLDLSERDASHQLFVAARTMHPRVDLLVNNAGFGLYGPFVETPLPRIQAMVQLHVAAVIETIRLFLPTMIEQRAGGIITVASTAGLFPVPYLSEYAATKAFLITFMESLAEEVRPYGVRMQVCCPGTTATDFHATAGFRPKASLSCVAPERVVLSSLAALERNQVFVTIGGSGRLLAYLSRWLPRRFLAKAAIAWMHRVNAGPQERSA